MGALPSSSVSDGSLDGLVVWSVKPGPRGTLELEASDPQGRHKRAGGVCIVVGEERDCHRAAGKAKVAPQVLAGVSAVVHASAVVQLVPFRQQQQQDHCRSVQEPLCAMQWSPVTAARALAPLVPFSISHAAARDGRLRFVAIPLALAGSPGQGAVQLARAEPPTCCDGSLPALRDVSDVFGGQSTRSELLSGVAVSLFGMSALSVDFRSAQVGAAPQERWAVRSVAVPQLLEQPAGPTIYTVSVVMHDSPAWAVRRRYGAFAALRDHLLQLGGVPSEPQFPPKLWVHDGEAIAERRVMLEDWLQAVVAWCQSGALPKARALVGTFLGVEAAIAVPPGAQAAVYRIARPGPGGELGYGCDEAGVLLEVVPGGPAAAAGLASGMRLLSVGGVTFAALSAATRSRGEAGTVVVVAQALEHRSGLRSPDPAPALQSACSRLSGRSGRSGRSSLRTASSQLSLSPLMKKSVSFSGKEDVLLISPRATDAPFGHRGDDTICGAQVELSGLVRLTDVNGQQGEVLGYVPDRDKYHVRLNYSDEEVLVNRSNMTVVSACPCSFASATTHPQPAHAEHEAEPVVTSPRVVRESKLPAGVQVERRAVTQASP